MLEICRGERPKSRSSATRGDRVLSTLQQRIRGSLTIAEATSASPRPMPVRKARTASGLAGLLRWATCLDDLRASAGVRPHLVMRKSSATKRERFAAVVERRRWWWREAAAGHRKGGGFGCAASRRAVGPTLLTVTALVIPTVV